MGEFKVTEYEYVCVARDYEVTATSAAEAVAYVHSWNRTLSIDYLNVQDSEMELLYEDSIPSEWQVTCPDMEDVHIDAGRVDSGDRPYTSVSARGFVGFRRHTDEALDL